MNQRVANLLNVMGVRVLSSPSCSPFANGIVERHNGVLKQTMDKMKEENSTQNWDLNSDERILAHSVFSKNATLSSHGNSACMKTYGKDAQLIPGPESQDITITDEWVQRRVEEIVSARKAVIQAENEIRVKHSLHNRANPLPEMLEQGDLVQYYRELCSKDKRGWYGPAKIISRNGKDETMLSDKKMISAHYRDVREIRSDSDFKWGIKPLTEEIQKRMMTNKETNDDKQNLIKRNHRGQREVKKTQCHFWRGQHACVKKIIPRTQYKQNRKQPKSVNDIAAWLFINRYVCVNCLQ